MFTEELYQERKDADATPKIGSIQTFGKHTFVWTSEHLLASETAPLRKEFDNLCAESLDTLLQIGKERTSLTGCPKGPVDDYSLLEQTHTIDPTLDKLWTQINTVPSWVDWAQIERGQKFFYRYALANIVGFAFQGFIGESTVAESAVEVLVRTGGFSIRMMLYRVLETFQFLLQATRSLEAIQPGGDGHISTVRVRFLHARVRKRILGLVERNGEYFDVVKHGPPINDLDAVLTNTFFCCNPMWIQLPLLGIQPKPDEIEDYIALFRYLAYLLGTPDDYFSSAKRAKMTMESLLVNELRPTENSKVVAANFISCLVDRPPFNVSRGFMEAGSREMNGDTLCDALRLGRPSFIWYIAFRGLVWLMQLLAFIQRIHPSMDRILIEFFRTKLYSAIVENKDALAGGTKFAFRNVPRLGKKTQIERAEYWGPMKSWIKRPVETFFVSIIVVPVVLGTSICSLFLFLILSTFLNVSSYMQGFSCEKILRHDSI